MSELELFHELGAGGQSVAYIRRPVHRWAVKKPGTSEGDTVAVGSPNVPSYHSRTDAKKYYAMRNVLAKVFTNKKPGIT